MSKLTKFLKNPVQFYVDAFNKRTVAKQKAKASPPAKKPAKPAPKPAPKPKPAPPKKQTVLKACSILAFLKYMHVTSMIHTGEGMNFGPPHLAQWLPAFARSRERHLLLVRNLELYEYVRKTWPDTAVVFAKDLVNVDEVLACLPHLRTIYYLSNTGNLIHTLRLSNVNHVFLGHGDSNKKSSAHKFFRVYDEVWTAGEAHIDRFRNAGFDTRHMVFRKIGRPNLEETWRRCRGTPWDRRSAPMRILYAPTWEGVLDSDSGSSMRLAPEFAKAALSMGCRISIKFHPASGKRWRGFADLEKKIKDLAKKWPDAVELVPKTVPLEEAAERCSCYVCDVSAAATEFLACMGPMAVYLKDGPVEGTDTQMPLEEFCIPFSDVEGFKKAVLDMETGLYPREKLEEARRYYLGVDCMERGDFYACLEAMHADEGEAARP